MVTSVTRAVNEKSVNVSLVVVVVVVVDDDDDDDDFSFRLTNGAVGSA